MPENTRINELVESCDEPVLLMQRNPRQVVTANRKALALFGKQLHEVEGHRGGEVFDCVHSFTAAGCGKDEHCEPCKIRLAIVDTFNTGNPHQNVSTGMEVRKAGSTKTHVLQVSTEKAGDMELVKINHYGAEAHFAR